MTKRDEITLLSATIAKFGQNSYIGPWLMDNFDAITRDITADVCIEVKLPADARREAADILAQATAEAARIVKDAQETAARTLAATYTKVDSIRVAARNELERLAARI